MSRIISGRYGGLYLQVSRHTLRPTTGKIKEFIFNVLQSLEGRRVIDLFSGTGALGIEALSRYASHVTFVDNDPRSIQLIRSNLEKIGAEKGIFECVKSNALHYFKRDLNTYDLILADPPYDLPLPSLFFASCREHLGDDGVFILEYASRAILDTEDWEPFRTKKAGDTVVYFFSKD